eukprot:GHVU01193332.1.p4 GENE.GHVU01193332.1~~GHVU01193332.1.p4  ORF type:complete len:100 (-),score=5.15 GHVU01193332.1:218-517(-)
MTNAFEVPSYIYTHTYVCAYLWEKPRLVPFLNDNRHNLRLLHSQAPHCGLEHLQLLKYVSKVPVRHAVPQVNDSARRLLIAALVIVVMTQTQQQQAMKE